MRNLEVLGNFEDPRIELNDIGIKTIPLLGGKLFMISQPLCLFEKKLTLINVGEPNPDKHLTSVSYYIPGAIKIKNTIFAHPAIIDKVKLINKSHQKLWK